MQNLSFFASESFQFLLHIPTIFIVAIFYRFVWLPLVYSFMDRWSLIVKLIGFTLIADGITFSCYLFLKKYPIVLPLWVGFAITSLMLLSLLWCKKNHRRLSLQKIMLLGFVQGCALIPGVSRLGAVFTAGRWLGLSAKKSFAVAWMLQWPLMIGAVGLAILKERSLMVLFSAQSVLLVGVAMIAAYAAFALAYFAALRNSFWLFGIYILIPLALSFMLYC